LGSPDHASDDDLEALAESLGSTGVGAGKQHVPVLPSEVLEGLNPQPGQILVDLTLGGGGHSRLLAERVGPTGKVYAFDCDPHQVEKARQRLAGLPVECFHARYDQAGEILRRLGVKAHGILADLGICSEQLDDPGRGLAFRHEGPLDMRLDPSRGEPAWKLLERLDENDLTRALLRYGEEKQARRIVRKIVEARKEDLPWTTTRLAELVRSCLPPRGVVGKIDPATRTFQGLRILVNDELAVLEDMLRQLPGWLVPGGLAAIISFHSLEDRLVKQAFARGELWERVTRKPVIAGEDEVKANPRSRSAKLRVARLASGQGH
jgi:16S rRNA (cytosine1402-N4)-methyltransferase